MNIDPHPSPDDNPRNVKQDIENAHVTVTWKTKDGGNATLSADLDKASFLSVYPRVHQEHMWRGCYQDLVSEMGEVPEHMGLTWKPKIGWSYTIKMAEPIKKEDKVKLKVRKLITVEVPNINMKTLEEARSAAGAPTDASLEIVKVGYLQYEVTFSWEVITRD